MKLAWVCLFIALSPIAALATPTSYNCHVMVLAADLPNGSFEANYVAPAQGQSHGGQEQDFTFVTYKVGVLADSKWLAISWEKNGKLVATATSVRSEETQKTMVLIVANPANPQEQVSVDCSAAQ